MSTPTSLTAGSRLLRPLLYIITDYTQLLRNCPLRRVIDDYVKLAAFGARNNTRAGKP